MTRPTTPLKLKALRRAVLEAAMVAIDKNKSLAGFTKAGCECQTCRVNRAINGVFRRQLYVQ